MEIHWLLSNAYKMLNWEHICGAVLEIGITSSTTQ